VMLTTRAADPCGPGRCGPTQGRGRRGRPPGRLGRSGPGGVAMLPPRPNALSVRAVRRRAQHALRVQRRRPSDARSLSTFRTGGYPPGATTNEQHRPSPPPPTWSLGAMGLGTPCTHILILNFTCYFRDEVYVSDARTPRPWDEASSPTPESTSSSEAHWAPMGKRVKSNETSYKMLQDYDTRLTTGQTKKAM